MVKGEVNLPLRVGDGVLVSQRMKQFWGVGHQIWITSMKSTHTGRHRYPHWGRRWNRSGRVWHRHRRDRHRHCRWWQATEDASSPPFSWFCQDRRDPPFARCRCDCEFGGPASRRAVGCQGDHNYGNRSRDPDRRPGQCGPDGDGKLPNAKIREFGFRGKLTMAKTEETFSSQRLFRCEEGGPRPASPVIDDDA